MTPGRSRSIEDLHDGAVAGKEREMSALTEGYVRAADLEDVEPEPPSAHSPIAWSAMHEVQQQSAATASSGTESMWVAANR